MSHYAVAVFSDDCNFEELLDPYRTGNTKEYTFHPIEYSEIVRMFEDFAKLNPQWTLDNYIAGFHYVQENGVWGRWYNDNGHLDYYTLDGKEYLFTLKKRVKRTADYYRKNDYDWFVTDWDDEEDAKWFWNRYIATTENGDPPSMYTRKYYLERFKTLDQYIKERCRTLPYAFITPDGVWHAPGSVGYFGQSDETADSWNEYAKEWEAFINDKTNNPYVSIVDCHI